MYSGHKIINLFEETTIVILFYFQKDWNTIKLTLKQMQIHVYVFPFSNMPHFSLQKPCYCDAKCGILQAENMNPLEEVGL